jgi:hypothetical protein
VAELTISSYRLRSICGCGVDGGNVHGRDGGDGGWLVAGDGMERSEVSCFNVRHTLLGNGGKRSSQMVGITDGLLRCTYYGAIFKFQF